MTSKTFVFGNPAKPSLILGVPSTGLITFRRVTKARAAKPGLMTSAVKFPDDVRVHVTSLRAARQLVRIANAILKAKEAELLKSVVIP